MVSDDNVSRTGLRSTCLLYLRATALLKMSTAVHMYGNVRDSNGRGCDQYFCSSESCARYINIPHEDIQIKSLDLANHQVFSWIFGIGEIANQTVPVSEPKNQSSKLSAEPNCCKRSLTSADISIPRACSQAENTNMLAYPIIHRIGSNSMNWFIQQTLGMVAVSAAKSRVSSSHFPTMMSTLLIGDVW